MDFITEAVKRLLLLVKHSDAALHAWIVAPLKRLAMTINVVIKLSLIFFIKIYQFLLSPFVAQNACRFYPSCSQYMTDSLKKHGIIKGLYFGAWRLLRCNSWSCGGNDPIK